MYTYYLNILTGELRRSDHHYTHYKWIGPIRLTLGGSDISHLDQNDLWYQFQDCRNLTNPTYIGGKLAREDRYFTLYTYTHPWSHREPRVRLRVYLTVEQIEYRTIELIKQQFEKA